MSTPTTPPTGPARPRQVTLAAWLIMGGSALVVVTVFDRMAGLHSLETRESVQRFLAEPPGDDLGLGVSDVLDMLRVFCMVAAGCATAAAILGYQVLRRSRSARVALTVLAVPLFVSGLVTGGFLSSLVAAASVMLWLQPSRDWFAGRTPPPAATVTPRESMPADPARPPAGPGPSPTPWPAPPRQQEAPEGRPPVVAWACALTWVFAGLTLVVMSTSVAVLATSPGLVFDELHRQNPDLASAGLSDDTLRTTTFVLAAVIVVWSLAALVFAVLAFRRVRWARVALAIAAGGAVPFCLLATLGQVFMVLPLAASVMTLAFMVRPDSRDWFDRR